MAVEATHHTLFHPQMLLTTPNNIDNQTNNTPPIGYTINNPMYGFINDSSLNPLKSESGLTCSLPVSRKRPRDNSTNNTDHMNHLFSLVNTRNMVHNNQFEQQRHGTSYSFLGEDISLQLQQQQLEIDQFVAHHNEKMRLEIEERRKRNTQRIISAVEEGVSKRLRAKEEEIVKIAKLNWALEEKVKSLCVENQIWRELAQTNEATANTLRNNLKQVLEQVVINDDYILKRTGTTGPSAAGCVDHELAEDAQSCCESNNEEKFGTDIEKTNNHEFDCSTNISNLNNNNNNRLCKKCGMDESCVLLLPCRHLCLCKGCASSVNICPVCKSTKNISVHVNMS